MQVFSEIIKSDLTEDQILPILRELLPVLLNILGSTQVRDYDTVADKHILSSCPAHAHYTCTIDFSIPAMRNDTIYGERTAREGSQGSDEQHSACVDRRFQDPSFRSG